MSNKVYKDVYFRLKFKNIESRAKALKFVTRSFDCPTFIRNYCRLKLNKINTNSSYVKIKNRCSFTGRSQGILRTQKVSRHTFKYFGSLGFIPGLNKAIW